MLLGNPVCNWCAYEGAVLLMSSVLVSLQLCEQEKEQDVSYWNHLSGEGQVTLAFLVFLPILY